MVETVHLAQLDHAEVPYVDMRHATKPLTTYSQAGKVGPAHCTGVGKAMLVHLPQDALPGILAQQSFHRATPQMRSDAAALRTQAGPDPRPRPRARPRGARAGHNLRRRPDPDAGGQRAGTQSVTSPTARTSLDALAARAPQLRDAARAIAASARAGRYPDRAAAAPGRQARR